MAGCGLSEDAFFSSFFYNYTSSWESSYNQQGWGRGGEKINTREYTIELVDAVMAICTIRSASTGSRFKKSVSSVVELTAN
ncbi:fatty acyl-CoA hydrolase precursor, medium chain-like [Platysternon megacephalum]|uniref:Fatty acyl-CoA hydrolase, medium chain-like n=1 Tax=Platysternon megacephalum TaxID=55544 RepID=A0A4D9FAC9_9SAUR|nr:fatty acyl-CoA hydrolase precursor, medium chain-like [Platysternon megacephalum]